MEAHSSRRPSHPPALALAAEVAKTPHHSQPETQQPASQTPAKPDLRSVLRTILLKDWYTRPTDCSPTLTTTSTTKSRPQMMRMKDSDDYITARGANPRTGLISPSPATPGTPDSPAEALKLRKLVLVSPTPAAEPAELSSKANQGRKISGRHSRKWHEHETQLYALSRRSSTPSVCDDGTSQYSVAREDQFVVHMPSAQEPQPFAYPGYTAQQIQALEHYERKARRTSSDGYDRRLIHCSGKLAAPPGAFDSYDGSASDGDEDVWIVRSAPEQHFRPYRHGEALREVPPPSAHEILVRKRGHMHGDDRMHEIAHTPGAQSTSCNAKMPILRAKSRALSPAFTSPKPELGNRYAEEEQTPGEIIPRSSEVVHDTKHAQDALRTTARGRISRKAIGSAPRPTPVANGDRCREDQGHVPPPSLPPGPYRIIGRHPNGEHNKEDLSQLPRVRKLRQLPPLLAETRRHKPRRNAQDRNCSFGCDQDHSHGYCLQSRKGTTGTVVIRRKSSRADEFPLLPRDATTGPKEPDPTASAELMLGVGYSLLAYMQHLRVPIKSAQIETLMSPDASTREKAEALQAMLSMTAHAVAVCTILAMLWKFGVAVMHLLEVLLWPLAVPLRILRWVMSGAG